MGDLTLNEALISAALMVRTAALREGFGTAAAWRAADAIVRSGTANLLAVDLAPSGPEACQRADERCAEMYPPTTITPEDIDAVREHMAGLRARVLAARAAPSAYRARSIAICPIEELRAI